MKIKLCDVANCQYLKEYTCTISKRKCDFEHVKINGAWWYSCSQFDGLSCENCAFKVTCDNT